MGPFITVEGGEGVGKSVFCKDLEKHLQNKGFTTLLTREPGGGPLGHEVRQWLQDPARQPSPKTELLLVSAARVEHIRQVILPFLQKGGVVVCDRFIDSTRIYQGVLGEVDCEWLEQVIEQTTEDAVPSITFLLDCPVEVALQRLESRGGEKSRFDQQSVEGHEKIRQGFLKVAASLSERIKVLDASGTPEDTMRQALAYLEKM